MTQETNQRIERIANSYLEEYRALREEQRTRLSITSNMINILVVIVAAVISATVPMIKDSKFDILANIMLLVPIITTPLVLIYYDNQFMVYRIGKYLSESLYPKLRKLTNDDIFLWDAWHVSSSSKLAIVAFGRNLFLVLVISLPIIFFLFLKIQIAGMDDTMTVLCKLKSSWALYHSWEKWIFGIDIIFFLIVIGTWINSGIMFGMINSKKIQ